MIKKTLHHLRKSQECFSSEDQGKRRALYTLSEAVPILKWYANFNKSVKHQSSKKDSINF